MVGCYTNEWIARIYIYVIFKNKENEKLLKHKFVFL